MNTSHASPVTGQVLQTTSPDKPIGPAPVTDFRSYLQREFLRRCRANPRYSLRAFARTLQVDPSSLCKILNGKRSITSVMFDHLSGKLTLSPSELETLRPRNGVPAQAEYKAIAHDLFEIVSEWYHYAILCLAKTSSFDPDPKSIAAALGITSQEVRAAIERLIRTGFLEIMEDGHWVIRMNASTTSPHTSTALRKLQTQFLTLAAHALEEVPLEERDQSTMSIAVDSTLLPQAKEKIKAFRRELTEFLENSPRKDRVYHLTTAFYPVSQVKRTSAESEAT